MNATFLQTNAIFYRAPTDFSPTIPGEKLAVSREAMSSGIKSRPSRQKLRGTLVLDGKRWISEVWRTVREASSLTANHCHSPAGKTKSRVGRVKKEKKRNVLQTLKGGSNYLFTRSEERRAASRRRRRVWIFASLSLFSNLLSASFAHPAFEKIRQRGATSLTLITVITSHTYH